MEHAPSPILVDLKVRVQAIEGRRPVGNSAMFSMGHGAIDERMGGGMALGRLHEIHAADAADQPCVTGFALMLAVRMGAGPILWLRQDRGVTGAGQLYAPGLADLGCDPSRIIEVHAPDETALMRAAGEAVRCRQLAALVIEPWKAARGFDLTASRRLTLIAEKTGVTIFLLRSGADPTPSAAHTRWQVRAAPSTPLAAGAPGHAAIDIALTRHRGGVAAFRQHLEWDRDQPGFRDPPVSRDLVSFPAGGSPGARDVHYVVRRTG